MTISVNIDLSVVSSNDVKQQLAKLMFNLEFEGLPATFVDKQEFACKECKAVNHTNLQITLSSVEFLDETCETEENPLDALVDDNPSYEEDDQEIDVEEILVIQKEERPYTPLEEPDLEPDAASETEEAPDEKISDLGYFCGICNAVFEATTGAEHRRAVHFSVKHAYKRITFPNNRSGYQCLLCSDNFPLNRGEFKQHLRDQHATGTLQVYFCNECGKTTNDVGKMKDHLFAHSSVKQYSCQLCPYEINSSEQFKDHIDRHENRADKFHCSLCGANFVSRILFGRHNCQALPRKQKRRPKECRHCGKVFSSQISRDRHERSLHSERRDFVCNWCSKGFKVKQYLRIHERIHTGERPYGCNHCGKRFSDHSIYGRHKKRCGKGESVVEEAIQVGQ